MDVKRESEACKARNVEMWALLMSRLCSLGIDTSCSVDDEAVKKAPHLRRCARGREAMVYRVMGSPPQPQVLIIANLWDSSDQSGMSWDEIVDEAVKRDRM